MTSGAREEREDVHAVRGTAREAFPLPPGCDEGYVEANGVRLHYVSAGSGPLVLLLHGFPEFWYSWHDVLPALADRRRVVALDLRGYNLSDKPATGYDIATLTDDLRGVIAAFGERQADVVGHDWGGGLAWSFAIRCPEQVRRLAILNAPHPAAILRELRHPQQLARSSYMGFFQLPAIPEAVIAARDYALLRRTFRGADPDATWLTDTDIERYVAALARPGALTAALNYYRMLRAGPGVLGPMRVITAPTLVLWGLRDPYLGAAVLDGLPEWVHALHIVFFPEAGHWLAQQESARVIEELRLFLA